MQGNGRIETITGGIPERDVMYVPSSGAIFPGSLAGLAPTIEEARAMAEKTPPTEHEPVVIWQFGFKPNSDAVVRVAIPLGMVDGLCCDLLRAAAEHPSART